MKITDEMIKRMALDPYDDWDVDDDAGTVNIGIEGIEQDVRDYFKMQPEDYPDSYVVMFVDINPKTMEAVSIYVCLVSGFDAIPDKNEAIKVPKKYGKKIFNQIVNSNEKLKEEFLKWIEEEGKR